MGDCALVTGAAGNLGTALIARLLREPDQRVFALVRARDSKHLAERRTKMIRNLGSDTDFERLVFVQGDVTQPGLGMSREDQDTVLAQVNAVIHAAASIRFDMPRNFAAQQNIRGTAFVLELAQQIQERGNFHRLDYISTCYIAGDRRGRVYEHECDVGQRFRNSYEWSKCQSEVLVRKAIRDGLCATIHRPSILAGDSRNGVTHSFTALYWPLKVYARGWWRILPGRPDALIDIVPIDYVAEAITRLRKNIDTIGTCFHLASGEAAARVEELALRLQELMDGPPVRYVDQRVWRRIVRPLMVSALRFVPHGDKIRRGTDVYMPYFESNPLFDTSNSDRYLANTRPPEVLSYFDQIVRFACACDFGRNL